MVDADKKNQEKGKKKVTKRILYLNMYGIYLYKINCIMVREEQKRGFIV